MTCSESGPKATRSSASMNCSSVRGLRCLLLDEDADPDEEELEGLLLLLLLALLPKLKKLNLLVVSFSYL